jgi:hypothetical protein
MVSRVPPMREAMMINTRRKAAVRLNARPG